MPKMEGPTPVSIGTWTASTSPAEAPDELMVDLLNLGWKKVADGVVVDTGGKQEKDSRSAGSTSENTNNPDQTAAAPSPQTTQSASSESAGATETKTQ